MQRRGGEYSTATIVLHVECGFSLFVTCKGVPVLVIVLHSTTKLVVIVVLLFPFCKSIEYYRT